MIEIDTSDGICAFDSQPDYMLGLSLTLEKDGNKESFADAFAGMDPFIHHTHHV